MVGWEKHDFWKYWAISIPLTFFVLAVLTLYMFIVDRMSKRRTRAAQNELLKKTE